MNLSLNPETTRFIDEQVKAGRFASAEALVEAAVADLRDVESCLDDEAVDAINEAEAEADRGEGMELDAFRTRISQRFREA